MVLRPDNHWTLRNSKIFLNKMVPHYTPYTEPYNFPWGKVVALSLSLSLFRTLQTRALVVEPSHFVLTAGQATDEEYAIHFQTKSDWTTDPYKADWEWRLQETSETLQSSCTNTSGHIRDLFIYLFIYLYCSSTLADLTLVIVYL